MFVMQMDTRRMTPSMGKAAVLQPVVLLAVVLMPSLDLACNRNSSVGWMKLVTAISFLNCQRSSCLHRNITTVVVRTARLLSVTIGSCSRPCSLPWRTRKVIYLFVN